MKLPGSRTLAFPRFLFSSVLLILTLLICFFAGKEFLLQRQPEPIYPSPGLTFQKKIE